MLFHGEARAVEVFRLDPAQSAPPVDASAAFRAALGSSDGSFTTLHLSEWAEGAAPRIFLLDENTQQKRVLSCRSINRHRDFDITRFLRRGHSYSFIISSVGNQAQVNVDELNVRTFPGVPYFPPLDVCLTLAFLAAVVATRMGRGQNPIRTWEIVGALMLVAFLIRWRALGATFGQPLEGDAGGYRELALNLSWARPFQNSIREPFYIWIQNFWMNMFGTEIWKFRMVTLLISVSSIPVLYFLSVVLSGRRSIAAVACLLVAAGEYAVLDAVRGERNQLFGFLVIVFCWGILKWAPRSAQREALLATIGGFIGWTWLVGTIGVVLAYSCRWIYFRIPLRRATGFWLVLVAMISGFLFQQWKYRGDPLQSINAHVNFYKNAKETGVPSYSGQRTNWFRYLLGDQGALKIVKDSAKGLFDLLLNPTNAFNKTFLGFHYSLSYSYALYPFLVVGLLLTIYRKEFWPGVLMLSFLNISASLLNDVRDPRLFYHLTPFFAYFFSYGLISVGEFLFRSTGFFAASTKEHVPTVGSKG